MKRRKLLEAAGVLTAVSLIGLPTAAKSLNDTLSQTAINNANILIKTLRKRLAEKVRGHYDPNPEYLCRLFMRTLSEFNGVPSFTLYSLEDTEFLVQHHTLLVDGAYLYWGAHTVIDNKHGWRRESKPVPTTSQVMKTYWSHSVSEWLERIKAGKSQA